MSDELPKVVISIELEAGFDELWDECGLEEPPESAEALLEQIKADHQTISKFIRDWDLLNGVTVSISVRKPHPDRPLLAEVTHASWSEP